MSVRQSWSSGPLFPGRLLIWPEIATGRPPSQTVVLGLSGSIEVGQPLDTLGRKLRQRLANTPSRNDTVGHDLGQRHQHEGALESPRMRQRQFRLVEPDVV